MHAILIDAILPRFFFYGGQGPWPGRLISPSMLQTTDNTEQGSGFEKKKEQDIAEYSNQIMYSKRYSDAEFEYR